jgi:hypothetical protein
MAVYAFPAWRTILAAIDCLLLAGACRSAHANNAGVRHSGQLVRTLHPFHGALFRMDFIRRVRYSSRSPGDQLTDSRGPAPTVLGSIDGQGGQAGTFPPCRVSAVSNGGGVFHRSCSTVTVKISAKKQVGIIA